MSISVESLGAFDPRFPLNRRELGMLADRLLVFLGFEGAGLDLRVVDDREMARLNREYLGMVGPTNVLSFPAAECGDGPAVLQDGEWDGDLHEEWIDDSPAEDCGCGDEAGDGDEGFLGSIALSADTLAREAFLYGQPPRAHMVRLLAHAILHLAGYGHGTEMYELTDRAVDSLA